MNQPSDDADSVDGEQVSAFPGVAERGLTACSLRWAGQRDVVPSVVPDRAIWDGEAFRWIACGRECLHKAVTL